MLISLKVNKKINIQMSPINLIKINITNIKFL